MSHRGLFSGDGTAGEPGQDPKKKNNNKTSNKPTRKVPILKLFKYADSYDYFLMFVGSIGACAHGASVPVFFIFFGKMINIIGLAYLFPALASHQVAKVCNLFCPPKKILY